MTLPKREDTRLKGWISADAVGVDHKLDDQGRLLLNLHDDAIVTRDKDGTLITNMQSTAMRNLLARLRKCEDTLGI